jgi:phosphatidyl-myo-inositol dimannoside synthase
MSKAVVFIEERFYIDSDGIFCSSVFNDAFWARYLSVFDSVDVVARARKDYEGISWRVGDQILDPRVRVVVVPYYKGMVGFISVFPSLLFAIFRTCRSDSSFILRLPGVIGGIASVFLVILRRRYAVELVGDPYQVFSHGGVGGRFSRLLKWIFYGVTRVACANAAAVSYVSRKVMRPRYPHSSGAYSTHYSSIFLPHNLIVSHRVVRSMVPGCPFILIAVGSMEQRYKGFDLLIMALAKLAPDFPDVRLHVVGDGVFRGELQDLASSLGISDRVSFLGSIPREQVFVELDGADILVMPSRTEGLPRVLIEAFARGLPCIGSDVGGIPELLPPGCLFPVGDVSAIAERLAMLIPDACQRQQLSQRNISLAWDYEESRLDQRRTAFYRYLQSGGL